MQDLQRISFIFFSRILLQKYLKRTNLTVEEGLRAPFNLHSIEQRRYLELTKRQLQKINEMSQVYIYNPGQNIWKKLKKSSKIRQDHKTLANDLRHRILGN